MYKENNLPELSYFGLVLKAFLRDSFHEKANDTSLISSRGNQAAETYEAAIRNGSTPVEAEELAREQLFHGLLFSKMEFVITILNDEFEEEVLQIQVEETAKMLMPLCETVFANYKLTDDFNETAEYDLLYTELTGTIQIYIEEHGL
jgi:hypothetical protein